MEVASALMWVNTMPEDARHAVIRYSQQVDRQWQLARGTGGKLVGAWGSPTRLGVVPRGAPAGHYHLLQPEVDVIKEPTCWSCQPKLTDEQWDALVARKRRTQLAAAGHPLPNLAAAPVIVVGRLNAPPRGWDSSDMVQVPGVHDVGFVAAATGPDAATGGPKPAPPLLPPVPPPVERMPRSPAPATPAAAQHEQPAPAPAALDQEQTLSLAAGVGDAPAGGQAPATGLAQGSPGLPPAVQASGYVSASASPPLSEQHVQQAGGMQQAGPVVNPPGVISPSMSPSPREVDGAAQQGQGTAPPAQPLPPQAPAPPPPGMAPAQLPGPGGVAQQQAPGGLPADPGAPAAPLVGAVNARELPSHAVASSPPATDLAAQQYPPGALVQPPTTPAPQPDPQVSDECLLTPSSAFRGPAGA